MSIRLPLCLAVCAGAGAVLLMSAGVNKTSVEELLAAIQAGSNARVKALLEEGADPNVTDSEGVPALMNAVLYGDAEMVRMLLGRGAVVNTRDSAGGTALLWAAGDPVKAGLLMDFGADVNAQSESGRTPLMTAAATAGGAGTVALMLQAGANPNLRDRLSGIPIVWTGGGGGTALIEAARVGDLETVRLLVSHGADVNARDGHGGTALSEAAFYGRTKIVRFLLSKGARITATDAPSKKSPLALAAMRGNIAIADMLIAAGANVNETDESGVTPLMWAADSDHVNPRLISRLLKAGADPNLKDKQGETALIKARKRGQTAAVELLKGAGASPAQEKKEVIPAPIPAKGFDWSPLQSLLAHSATVSFQRTGCATCHHHTLTASAINLARRHGYGGDRTAEDKVRRLMIGMMKPVTTILLEGSDIVPDLPVTGSYFADSLAALEHRPDRMTTAMVHNIALKQARDGRWIGPFPRPPMEFGDIQATAYAVRALRLYRPPGRSEEFEDRVRRARRWLLHAEPKTTEEKIMRLLGLHWSAADQADISKAARTLLSAQRPHGGWAQLETLESDAYATGKALFALWQSGLLVPSSPEYRRGVAYLKRTREADGTWHVVSRSPAFQPLIDTGFPHGRDQWISAAASNWASMAIMAQNMPLSADQDLRNSRKY